MATFPALEPNSRSYDITGELPIVIEQAWPAGQVRYRTGYAPLASVGLQLQLEYLDLREAEVQLLREHYAFQQAGLVPFALPPVIFQGITGNVFPVGTQWRYTGAPKENQKKGGFIDVTVPLESMAYTAVPPEGANFNGADFTVSIGLVAGAASAPGDALGADLIVTASIEGGIVADNSSAGFDIAVPLSLIAGAASPGDASGFGIAAVEFTLTVSPVGTSLSVFALSTVNSSATLQLLVTPVDFL